MSSSSLNIVQLNMGHAAAVSDQLLDHCRTVKADIALVQEPYTNRGRLVGFEVAPFRCFLSLPTNRRGRPEYLDHGAAIIVFNPDLVVVPPESQENFVSLDIDCGVDGIITLISGYFKYRVPTAIHVAALETQLTSAMDKVIVCLDANAFSRRWFSRITDARGETLTTCIDAHNLDIINVRSPHTTFHGPRGSTNIDVTLADHSFRINLHLRLFVHRETRFNLQKRNYNQFRQLYEAYAESRATGQLNIDSFANGIIEDVTAATVEHAQRSKRPLMVTPPWWSKELRDARRAMRAEARRLHTTGDRQRFNALRNAYT